MEFSASVDPSARYVRIDPFFYNDQLIGVLEGNSVLGTVSRKRTISLRIEQRSSYKHPIVGVIVGAIFVGFPVLSVAGEIFELPVPGLNFASPARGFGGLFLFVIGLYLLWGVIRRHDQPWVVFMSMAAEQAFPLPSEPTAELVEKVRSLCEGAMH